MPTASDAARAEAATWLEVAATVADLADIDDRPPSERAVVVHYDPEADLRRRGEAWGYEFGSCDLAEIARFAAGLAEAEGDGWDSGAGDLATRAYAERRFLLSDRVLHWAVPWLDAVGRCYPERRHLAHARRDDLLDLGEQHRPAPALAAGEGLYQPGHDAIGPLEDLVAEAAVGTLWGGALILASTMESMTGRRLDPTELDAETVAGLASELAVYYEAVSARWARLAAEYPGSAELWRALAARAATTSELLTRQRGDR